MPLEIKLKDGSVLAFPTPIVRYQAPEAEAVNPRLREIVLARAVAEEGIRRSNVGGWHSKDDLREWNEPEIQVFKRWIQGGARRMLQILSAEKGAAQQGELQVVAWANVSRQGDYNKIHNHPGCSFSGVYYVDVGQPDPEAHETGYIEFLEPRLGADMIELPGSPFGGKHKVEPENGLMLVFPAWLYHYVNPYHGPGERISIAFNITVKSFGPKGGSQTK